MSYAIEIYNLKKNFVKDKRFSEFLFNPFKKEVITALDDVSLKVNKGEICGLLGPNGAGKTTLIKILATLIIPDSGKAYVNGHEIIKEENHVKDSIGLVHNDERSFFWRLTGRQNLEFFASLYRLKGKEAKTEANRVLEIVGLIDKADIRFDSYSTGMKRRMGIARGLLTNPDILLVDEPTSGVDPLSAIRIRRFLKEELVNKMKKTILLATHDLQEAQSICDKIVIIHKGKIKANDSFKNLQKKMGSELIKMQVKAEKDTLLKINKIDGVKEVEINDKKLKVKVIDSYIALPKIIKLISKEKGEIYDCQTTHIDLDKIFEKFIGD